MFGGEVVAVVFFVEGEGDGLNDGGGFGEFGFIGEGGFEGDGEGIFDGKVVGDGDFAQAGKLFVQDDVAAGGLVVDDV